MTVILNFGHPLSARTLEQISDLRSGETISRTVNVKFTADFEKDFGEQAKALCDQCGLGPTDWQQVPFLVVLPGLSDMSAALLAEIHGRCGYWPSVIRMKRMTSEPGTPPQFELADIMPLQNYRDSARQRR